MALWLSQSLVELEQRNGFRGPWKSSALSEKLQQSLPAAFPISILPFLLASRTPNLGGGSALSPARKQLSKEAPPVHPSQCCSVPTAFLKPCLNGVLSRNRSLLAWILIKPKKDTLGGALLIHYICLWCGIITAGRLIIGLCILSELSAGIR